MRPGNTLRAFHLLSIVFVLFLCMTRYAAAQSVYVATDDREFGLLDVVTGDFTPIGTTTPFFFGMGFAPDGTLYGLENRLNSRLFEIDPATAATTNLGGVGHFAVGSTVGPDGLAYAIDFSTGDLYTVDPLTLAVNVIGNTGISADGLIAFAPDGTLFAGGFVGGTSDDLFQLDLTTGVGTHIGNLGDDLIPATGVFVGNVLYGFSLFGEIFSVDTSTGAGTFLNIYTLPSGGSILASAVPAVAAVPEPGLLTLLLGGGVGGSLVVLRRRRR